MPSDLHEAVHLDRIEGRLGPVKMDADLQGVPADYHDLHAVFNKARATSLPPHRPYNCAIDLLPGMGPPNGCLYSL